MTPSLTIWYRTAETAHYAVKSRWVSRRGFYLYVGLAIATVLPDFVLMMNNAVVGVAVAIAAGVVVALLVRLVFVTAIWLVGRVMGGQATRNEVETVFMLSALPQSIALPFIAKDMILGEPGELPALVVVILYLLTFRIAVLGLSAVQRYSYGFAVVNLFLTQCVLIGVLIAIRNLISA